jgi:hypothetical protein
VAITYSNTNVPQLRQPFAFLGGHALNNLLHTQQIRIGGLSRSLGGGSGCISAPVDFRVESGERCAAERCGGAVACTGSSGGETQAACGSEGGDGTD